MNEVPVAEGGQRPDWSALPAHARAAIEELVGSGVVESVTQRGGFSPGFASRLLLADGRRVFVKAGHDEINPLLVNAYRREAEVVPQLPREVRVPQVLGSVERDGWVIVAFEDIEGRTPPLPWRAQDLERVLETLAVNARALTPAPLEAKSIAEDLGDDFFQWRDLERHITIEQLASVSPWCADNLDRLRAAESRWVEASEGDTLLHCDLRADNILLTDDAVYVVDWNWVCVAQPWVDLIGLLPNSLMHGGIDPEQILRDFPLTTDVEPWRIDAVLAAMAGYFVVGSFQPPAPGLPTVRRFQLAQGLAAVEWLEQRWARE